MFIVGLCIFSFIILIAGLSLRFEVGGDILKVDGMFCLIVLFLLYFCNDSFFFSAYLCHFPAGENVQIAGHIAGRQRLLTTL